MEEINTPMTTMQNVIQSVNVMALLTILICIFFLFTDKQLTVCIIFRWWKFTKAEVKTYFCVLAVVTIIRLAHYITTDFTRAGSPPFAVLFNVVIAFGIAVMAWRIYKKRKEIRRRAEAAGMIV
jgi:H+/Cl- antiporter ClcA